jgi:Fructose-bisphosphate aldolase class-II
MRPASMAAVARAVQPSGPSRANLHLDHRDSVGMVRECIDAGCTSVMLDLSARPFEENVNGLQEAVALARPRGITVEGEIGKVGQADESAAEGSVASSLTDPADAVGYARRTGVDLLAVSIGNKHGFYRGDPRLDFELLADLHAKIPVPLVMHGGTGIPEKDIQRAIGLGIVKVNVASEPSTGSAGPSHPSGPAARTCGRPWQSRARLARSSPSWSDGSRSRAPTGTPDHAASPRCRETSPPPLPPPGNGAPARIAEQGLLGNFLFRVQIGVELRVLAIHGLRHATTRPVARIPKP